jgi:sn-glycerol 3-phosphate transport system ATP-binding protein
MAAISLRQVVKRYGRGTPAVIHGISAEIAEGEFAVIVGPSGCGKSTLLRMVAGLEAISGGDIVFIARDGAERIVNQVEPADRDIAMVFQNYALYPHMSVYDNMAYGLKIARVPKAEIEARVRRAAQSLELLPYLERTPRALSGGQRQRVAMGRAIVRQPQVFLFDEPLSNLDAKLRAQTRIEIRRLHAELGITSLFVTHDQVEAMTLAQRMIVLNAGRVEQIGSPETVYARPASRFVAGFIGSPPMNLFDGRGDGLRFAFADAAVALPAAAPRAGELTLGVRPEHLVIVGGDATAADGSAVWTLDVDLVEMLGAERLVHGRIGKQALTVRQDATQAAPTAGRPLTVRVRADHLHWFDAGSGLRIETT